MRARFANAGLGRRAGSSAGRPRARAVRERPLEHRMLMTATMCLLAFGAVMVYSASSATSLLQGEGYGDSSNGGISALGVYPAGQSPNAIVGYASDGHRRAYASALRPGARVGKGRAFSSRNGSMAVVRYFDYSHRATFKGPWANSGKGVKNRYLGLKFFVKGKIHFGWARLNVVISNDTPLGTLTGYAYETIPGKAIIAGATKGPDDDPQPIAATQPPAPKPATLGMLALGAPGLSIWRREEPATATSKGN